MQKRLLHLIVYLFFCVALCQSQDSLQVSSPDSITLYRSKATVFLSKKNNDSAIRCYQLAITLAKKNNQKEVLGIIYLSLANLYQYMGNTLAAAETYLLATPLLSNYGQKRTVIGLYKNLLTVYNRLRLKNTSLQNMLSAIADNNLKENDLIQLINTKGNDETGFNFPDQSLVKEVSGATVYVIFGNAKFVINDFKTLASYGSLRDVQRIPDGSLSSIPDFPRNGSIIREVNQPYVYIAKDLMLYRITNPEVLENYGGWDAVYFVPDSSLKNLRKAVQHVTTENVNTIFNLKQEFNNLTDSIKVSLEKNTLLSNQLSRQVTARNETLQKRKILLWASAISLMALLIIVFLLRHNYRQKQKLNFQSMQSLKAEQELKQKMELEKERTRIATDMHDDLGAGLSRIKFLSETIGIKKQQQLPIEEEINSIREYSHEMIDKMGEIVWALNEKNDSLSDLLSYTRSYAVAYLSQNGIECKVISPDNFPTTPVSGEFRRNIYLSVKETLHNIVKHSHSNLVTITFSLDKKLEVVIQDNGIGFDPENTRPYSNGLVNIKKRMADIQGDLIIKTGQGTVITLLTSLPV